MNFRGFTDNLKGLMTSLVGGIGDNDFLPMVHIVTGMGVTGWMAGEHMAAFSVALVTEHRPMLLGLTFHGQRGRLDGFFEHEVATVVAMDRERVEVWEARVVRHDGQASLGAWRPWPIDAAAGNLVTPIQEAMRHA